MRFVYHVKSAARQNLARESPRAGDSSDSLFCSSSRAFQPASAAYGLSRCCAPLLPCVWYHHYRDRQHTDFHGVVRFSSHGLMTAGFSSAVARSGGRRGLRPLPHRSACLRQRKLSPRARTQRLPEPCGSPIRRPNCSLPSATRKTRAGNRSAPRIRGVTTSRSLTSPARRAGNRPGCTRRIVASVRSNPASAGAASPPPRSAPPPIPEPPAPRCSRSR